MKILFLNHNYKGEGTYNRAAPLARELSKLGHKVTLFCSNNKYPSYKIEYVEGDFNEVLFPTLTRRRDYFWYLIRPILAGIETRKEKYDLVHAFTMAEPMSFLPAKYMCKRKFPLIVDWDDWYGKGGMAEFKPAGWFFKPFTSYLEDNGAKMGMGLTVVSECLYNRAKSLGISEKRIEIIGNGSNYDRIYPLERNACKKDLGFPVDKPIVLYLGWFNKALYIALEAFKSLESDFPDAQFVCVGRVSRKHDHLEEYNGLLNYAESSPRYHFTGQQPYEKVPKYLGAADIVLLPMEDTIHEHARFPIRLGDFLAAGRTVLASNIGEVGRIIRKNKCGVVANSPEQFKIRLNDLLSNPQRREWLEHLARQTAKHSLSWSGLAANLEEFYNKSFNFYSGK